MRRAYLGLFGNVALALLAAALLAPVAGCQFRARQTEGTTAQQYDGLALRFGKALVAGDYRSAHAMLSARLQKQMSLAELTAAAEQAQAEFGKPLACTKVGFITTTGLAGDDASQQHGFPGEIRDEDRLAWLHATLATAVDGDNVLACYLCWMLIEQESGQPRIGYFKFSPCE